MRFYFTPGLSVKIIAFSGQTNHIY